MPALWSPDDLATRFAPYIEELHDVFAMHGLHYGSPEDIGPLGARLETPGLLTEEVAALVRSMVLREGGSMPRTDLLEIVAIAISGPRMDPGGEELQQPVRQLLTFLHGSLRRPWNEPVGEERLHPEGDASRAEAARELREAAARIEAEAQTQHIQPVHEPAGEADTHPRANVIPFGRARAVFSRLAGMDGDSLPDEAEVVQEKRQEHAQVSEVEPERSEEIERAAPSAPWSTPAEVAGLREEAIVQSVATPEPAAIAARTQDRPLPPSPPAAVEADKQGQPAPVHNVARTLPAPGHDAPRTRTQIPPIAAAAVPIPLAAAEDAPREFDAEPPMPAPQRPMRIALVSCAIAAALVMGIFGLLSRGLSNTSSPVRSEAQAATTATANPEMAKPAPGMASATAAVQAAPAPPAASKPPAYDDYIAPPHSNMPPEVATAPAAASSSAGAAPEVSGGSATATPSARITPASFEVPAEPSRPRDRDAMIAGDLPGRSAIASVSVRPLHPSVPAAVMASNLLSAPRPDFPVLAKIAHVDGPVVLHAEITRTGAVSGTQVISGHHLLRHAAESAVRRWRYRPYQVDGKPTPVSTTITVRFRHDQ